MSSKKGSAWGKTNSAVSMRPRRQDICESIKLFMFFHGFIRLEKKFYLNVTFFRVILNIRLYWLKNVAFDERKEKFNI